MNQLYYCRDCGATHVSGYQHQEEESWFSAISAGIFCVVIIAVIGAIVFLSTGA